MTRRVGRERLTEGALAVNEPRLELCCIGRVLTYRVLRRNCVCPTATVENLNLSYRF
jgi:hypothetical protein